MNELIKITQNEKGENAVSARGLHEFLGIETRYNDWFSRMLEYGFVENQDFIAITQKRVTAQGNETTYQDHIISLDMAKELSMIQRTDKGKQARRYFIECEKQLKQQFRTPSNMIEALQLALEQQKQIEAQKLALEKAQPKIKFYDDVTSSSDTVDMATVAKVLNYKGIGRNKLFEILRNEKILMQNNQPYQKYIDSGYFRQIETKFTQADGNIKIYIKTVVFQKGVEAIRKILVEKYI